MYAGLFQDLHAASLTSGIGQLSLGGCMPFLTPRV